MRQGAAVPGTWKDDATGSGTYGNGVTTKQADKDKLAAAFDPTDDNQYDFSKSAAQDWWIERGATGDNPDITDVEAFANSAPWFLTNSGYATGGYNSGSNNLANPEKFAQYMTKNVEHLESLGANVDTVEPFNESETSYWGTPGDMASKYTDESDDNTKLINNYWDKYYSDKDKSVTPYSNALKKPQEGMHVNNAQQQQTITALAEALKDNDDTIIAATDATNSADFVKSYNQYPQAIKDLIGQYNVHAYSDSNQMQSRDIAQADGKKLSMSEVDGSWQSGSYNPYGFDNALGMMSKISSNVTRLQSKDFTFWQVVEDLYNMQMGSNVNPAGENTNWGTVLIDFDCTVAGKDGKLYSERRVNNNGGTADGLEPCTVIANAKYNGVKAITHFIHAGDKVIANNDEDNNMTATSADGKTQTVIHRNSGTSDQTFVIDLSKYGEIADNAYGELYLTTETSAEDKNVGVDSATPEVFAKTSNVKQAEGSVVIDKAAKTATVYVGALTVSDPVSATVLAGTSASEAKAALEAAPVYLHVKASPAFEGDAAKVTWNFDGLDTKLADAKAGDNIAVTGTYQLDDATTIALKGAIYVTAATPENVADTASNLTVTNQQTEYSKGDQWKKLTDGDTSAEAWVTWNSAGDYSDSPTATIDFGSECELSSVTITYGDKAPASAKAEYATDGETWMQLGSDVKPAAGQTVTFKADKGTVNATKVRIVNTVNNDYMNATEIQAFVTPVQGAAKNIAAASGTNFSVNFQEGASASKAIDGDTTSKGWSTWASTASTVDPVATFTFDEAQTITEVKTFFYYDGRASWPKSQTLEYQNEAGEWHGVGTKDGWKIQAGDAGSGSDGITAADTPTVDFVLGTPVKAKAIRLTNTLQNTKVYINVAEIQVFAQDSTVLTPQPASDATLGDLRLDGETVEGFDPSKTDYTVDLPVDAEANPVLQAFATDNAAAVKVTGDAVENGKLGGKAAITVTSADESETKTYTVTFNAFTLASLKVIGPTKTEYAIGDKLDTAGLKVTAVYQSVDKTKEVPVALDDPQLAIGSFDSTTAGKKAITVSYRGVTATFNVTVKANAVAPGPEEQKPGNTNKPGATGNGNKNTVANTGSSVAAIAGAVALLAAAAGALFMLRKRA